MTLKLLQIYLKNIKIIDIILTCMNTRIITCIYMCHIYDGYIIFPSIEWNKYFCSTMFIHNNKKVKFNNYMNIF